MKSYKERYRISSRRKREKRKKRIAAACGIMTVLLLLFFLPVLFRRFQDAPAWSLGKETPTLTPTAAISPAISPTISLTPAPVQLPDATSTSTPAPVRLPDATSTPTPAPEPTPTSELHLPVSAALLLNPENDEILYSYHAKDQLPPASVTKLMSALLVLEQGNLEDTVIATQSAMKIDCEGAARCGIRAGDRLTLYQVLHGMLLNSGNEAAQMVAEYTAGSIEEFVALMNLRASELGAGNTMFKNVHGLPNEEHLTTAYDISLIMKELMKHQSFFDISSKKTYNAYFENKSGQQVSLKFKNTNRYFTGEYQLIEGIEILGGKTGNTEAAGKCLALFVRAQNGKIYIAELFGAADYDDLYSSMNQLLSVIK